MDEVAATLFHELHHAYQSNKFKKLNTGNAADEITYPENAKNDALKLYEHKVLYEMSFSQDEYEFRELLNRFYSSRIKREDLIGDYIKYEKSIENFEGPAYYTEYKFYERYSDQPEPIKTNYYYNHFWAPLVTSYYGRQDLRLRHLAAGFTMCYLLDKYHTNWKTEFYQSEMNLFDFFVSMFEPEPVELPDLKLAYTLSKFHIEKQIAEREAEFEEFYEQSGTKVILDFQSIPQFRGFDPVNAVAIGEHTILHKTFLRLGKDDNQLFIENKDVVTLVEDQVFSVDKVILFVPEGAIDLQDDKIIVEVDGIKIQWSGVIIDQENNMVLVKAK